MHNSGKAEWVERSKDPKAVEGQSEIDISFEHDDYLIYVEAKLHSDISRRTTYDPQRNQIARNIDCLIDKAGERTPIFWMLVRDDRPDRKYTQLMSSYKADPSLLVRELPHRDPKKLVLVAQNLTILLWRDFSELVCGLGWDAVSTAVKKELERRIN
jgi:hypothetical protein